MAYGARFWTLFLGFLIPAAHLLAAGPVFGAVEQVTLYPRGASVLQRVELEKERSQVELILPGEARKDTLRVRSGAGRVQGVSVKKDQRGADPERIAELKRRIEELERKKAQTQNDLERLGKLIAFYEDKVSAETKGAKQTSEMADLLDESLEGLYEKRLASRQRRDEIKSELREVRKRLKELTGRSESILRVRVHLEEALPGGATLECSYYLDSASWSPEYTLNALPEEERVDLVWRAQVVQRSGLDWRDADLRVATATRSFRTDPPQVREWVIRPARAQKMAGDAEALSARAQQKEATRKPQRERAFSADIYELGRRNLPAGDKRRLTLRRLSLPADFVHLLRPLDGRECFIRANVRSDERMRLPQGKASLELEGTYVGQSAFSMRGKETTVSFGVDRDVVAEVARLTQKGGKQGFFQGEKTYQWGWRFTIANTRDQAVRLRLELPWPRLRSDEIELEPLYNFTEEDVREHRAVKELDLLPSSNATVEYGIRVVYPKEMELDFGRF